MFFPGPCFAGLGYKDGFVLLLLSMDYTSLSMSIYLSSHFIPCLIKNQIQCLNYFKVDGFYFVNLCLFSLLRYSTWG